ncbi:MAG: DUF3489 domain-containing protein [Caulobacteraceae bacterium]|nr:DUF3489 domain-containing protein [Caulobacteraceae bacterium]
MPRTSKTELPAAPRPRPSSKLDRLITILAREEGADMPAMIEATGWQAHSVRGAMAGALKKKGHAVTSEKTDDRRVWRIAQVAEPAEASPSSVTCAKLWSASQPWTSMRFGRCGGSGLVSRPRSAPLTSCAVRWPRRCR